jgi:hypothetical protein
MKTWMIESFVVAAILIVVAISSGNAAIEWIGTAAVFFGFQHAQIADRLAERQGQMPTVPCVNRLWMYYGAKEILWLSYFILHQSYAALVGVIVFLLYPFWRRAWRYYHPMKD